MGTHPIFESDFDCLTDKIRELMATIPTIDEQTAESVDLIRAQQDSNILLIDCRSKHEFTEGVIKSKNWINLPHYEVRKTFRLPDREFKTKFGISKPETNTEIIIYCREGRRAQDAVMSFLELGYRNSKNYFGGVNRWVREKRPVTK